MWTSPITVTPRAKENGKGEGFGNGYKEAFSIHITGCREHNPKNNFEDNSLYTNPYSTPIFTTIPPLLTNHVVLTLHPRAASSSPPRHVGADKAVTIHGYALTQLFFHLPVTDSTTGAQMVKRGDADSAYVITEKGTAKPKDADTAYTISKRNDADSAYVISEEGTAKPKDADTAYTIYKAGAGKRNDADSAYVISEEGTAKPKDADTAYVISESK